MYTQYHDDGLVMGFHVVDFTSEEPLRNMKLK